MRKHIDTLPSFIVMVYAAFDEAAGNACPTTVAPVAGFGAFACASTKGRGAACKQCCRRLAYAKVRRYHSMSMTFSAFVLACIRFLRLPDALLPSL